MLIVGTPEIVTSRTSRSICTGRRKRRACGRPGKLGWNSAVGQPVSSSISGDPERATAQLGGCTAPDNCDDKSVAALDVSHKN